MYWNPGYHEKEDSDLGVLTGSHIMSLPASMSKVNSQPSCSNLGTSYTRTRSAEENRGQRHLSRTGNLN